MTSLVDVNIDKNIATLTIQNGKVNALSHQVFDELNQALDRAEQQQAVVVITGQTGILSAGYDLKVMQSSPSAAKELVKKGSTLTQRMLAFPYPMLVACTGHAVAKGAFLLLAADYRLGIKGDFKIGLNEVAIGMTMHDAGIELARARLVPSFFYRCVLLAEMMSPDEAVIAGFLDKVVGEGAFQPTLQAIAQAMTKLDMQAHYQTKLKVRANLLTTLDESINKDAASD